MSLEKELDLCTDIPIMPYLNFTSLRNLVIRSICQFLGLLLDRDRGRRQALNCGSGLKDRSGRLRLVFKAPAETSVTNGSSLNIASCLQGP